MEASTPPNISPIFILLLGIMSAAIMLTIYHCIVVMWCNPQQPARRLQGSHRRPQTGEVTESVEFSTAQLIPPARMYSKGEGTVSEDQSTCAVCLSDFKDGEAVRLLPECLHCFHVSCIDMWLMSHTSCPMCRTATVPLPAAVVDSGEARATVFGVLLPSYGR